MIAAVFMALLGLVALNFIALGAWALASVWGVMLPFEYWPGRRAAFAAIALEAVGFAACLGAVLLAQTGWF